MTTSPTQEIPDARRAAASTVAALAASLGVAAVLSYTGLAPTSEKLLGYALDAPDGLREAAPLLSEAGVLVLVAGIFAGIALHRRSSPHVARLATGTAAAAIAYVASEALKLVERQPRPCHLYGEAVATGHCPPLGDWSLPSNHAVIAAGLAAVMVLAMPRSARWAVPVAVTVLVARVLAGVHHPHDVITGAFLGIGVVVVLVALTDAGGRQVIGRLQAQVGSHSRSASTS